MNSLRNDILLVINDFGFLKSHRLNLIYFLKDEGFNLKVATNLSNASNSDVNKLERSSINLVNFPFSRSSLNPISNLFYLFKLFKIIKDSNPKKLALISSKPIIFGGLSSLLFKFDRVFYHISGLGYTFISNSIKAKFLRLLILSIYKILFKKHQSTVVFQNQDDRDFFLEEGIVNETNSVVIKGNGIDVKRFIRQSYPEKLTFLFASRLLIDKGIMEFIEAAKTLNEDSVSFLIAGGIDDDNPKSINKEQLESLINYRFINYLGEIDYEDMPRIFNLADVFVLPSYREGLPKVALEAASSEMPLILNNVNGCRDCLIEGVTGFLTKMGSVEDLVGKMSFFINDENLSKQMGKKSREFVIENFSEEIIHKEFLKLYEN